MDMNSAPLAVLVFFIIYVCVYSVGGAIFSGVEWLENYYQLRWGWKKAFKGLRWNPHLKTWEKKQ